MNLREEISRARWYRTKTERVESARIVQRVPLHRGEILLVQVNGKDTYVVPSEGESVALSEPVALSLLRFIAEERADGGVRGHRLETVETALPAKIVSGEQSNTSVVFGDRYVGKIMRKLDEGESPDLEVGRFLTRAGYRHTPALAGWIEANGATLAVLYHFVENQGDAWPHALGSLSARASYAPLAERLGTRIGEMHAALASSPSDPAFAPEPLVLAPLVEAVRRAAARLPLNHLAEPTLRRLAELARLDDVGQRTRVHGDLHLGQVLVTGDDFVVIDFEGEPARPLSQRRSKRSPLVDVAGMLRSFHYAAVTSIRGGGDRHFAQAWHETATASFLDGYFRAAPAAVLPRSRALLDFFILEKCIYEVGYELDNRPDWVDIPLDGLRQIVGGADA